MNEFFRPLTYYKWVYENIGRIYSFKAKSIEGWRKWRKKFREKLVDLLGGFDYPSRPLSPKIVERKEFKEHVREKVLYWSDRFNLIPVYVLIPKNVEGRLPAVIAMHGHGYGKNDVVGIWEDGEDRVNPISRGYQKDFALSLVRHGFLVIAPEQSGFGERREREDVSMGPSSSSCWWITLWSLMLGKTTIGRRVWDAIKTIDYLETRNDVNKDRIGIMGISGGGTTTLFTSALDDRIKVTVVSGYLNTFKDSILTIKHCIDNYIPGILKYGEMYDIASLIAPKPLFIESGTKDQIFPIKSTKYAYEKVRRVYEFLGVTDRIDSEFFEGRHEICGRKAYKFLKKWLTSKEKLLEPKYS